jgi:hypothetical protein
MRTATLAMMAVVISVALTSHAAADAITIDFRGVVTEQFGDAPFPVGQPFSGSYTFDSPASIQLPLLLTMSAHRVASRLPGRFSIASRKAILSAFWDAGHLRRKS